MDLDVVYPYRLNKDALELRFSLRSIDRYLPHKNVWVIGELPSWARNIKYIYCPDTMLTKQDNVINKLVKICQRKELSENFILMNDDFFFLRESDVKNYTYGTLLNFESTKRGHYKKAILNTQTELIKLGIKDQINFELHYPMIFNKTKLAEVLKKYIGKHILHRSLYGNLNRMKGEERVDFKAYSIEQFKEKLKNEFISTDDKVPEDPKFKEEMLKLFPFHSKYEVKNTFN